MLGSWVIKKAQRSSTPHFGALCPLRWHSGTWHSGTWHSLRASEGGTHGQIAGGDLWVVALRAVTPSGPITAAATTTAPAAAACKEG